MMKTRVLSLFIAMSLLCGVAFAEPARVEYASYDAVMHCDAAVTASAVSLQVQAPGQAVMHSAVPRSDMRVASAGLVFNRAVGSIQGEEPPTS